jgi:hypothetical protein
LPSMLSTVLSTQTTDIISNSSVTTTAGTWSLAAINIKRTRGRPAGLKVVVNVLKATVPATYALPERLIQIYVIR